MKKSDSKVLRELGPYLHLSYQLVITIGLGAYGGWLLDKEYDTSPLWIIVLTFTGAAFGMTTFIRTALKSNNKNKDKAKK